MTTSQNRSYIPEIDQLRGFAALLVLAYHGLYLFGGPLAHGAPFEAASQWVKADQPFTALLAEGHTGVGLFLVLSGYVLSSGTIGRDIHYGRFVLARAVRIFPVLLVLLSVAAAAHPATLAGLLGTLPPFSTADSVKSPFTAMFWAVAVEVQCYLVFPFLLRFADRLGARMLLQVVLLAAALRLLAALADGANPRDLAYWTVLGRIDQFCLGMLAARIAWRPRGLLPFLAAALGVLALVWAYNRGGGWPAVSLWKLAWPTLEGVAWAAVILTWVHAGRAAPPALSGIATRLGEASYSIYMVHFPVMQMVVAQAWFVRPFGAGHLDAMATTILVALPIALGLGLLLFHTVERPFLALRPRYVAP